MQMWDNIETVSREYWMWDFEQSNYSDLVEICMDSSIVRIQRTDLWFELLLPSSTILDRLLIYWTNMLDSTLLCLIKFIPVIDIDEILGNYYDGQLLKIHYWENILNHTWIVKEPKMSFFHS